ncbi:hypothetical protein [Paraburkholderia sp.]|uniref:hypothetical protein n=1 Tax=Paraburkholderia sp. TaxID=1926495 RepID=UPI0039E241F3
MSAFRDALSQRIEELQTEGPGREWLVQTVDGRVLFRCHSREEAMNARALVVRLSREEVLGLKLSIASINPDYIERTGLKSADSRFCDWALLQLGRVSIATAPDEHDARFVVTSEGGHTVKGRTLAAALFGLVQLCAVKETDSSDEFSQVGKS